MALQVNGSGGSSSGQEVVETQLGPQLAELAISKAKNVSEASGGGSSSVGGQVKSRRRKQRRKIKALLRAELEAKNQEMLTDDSGTSLPDGILEDIFLRLPFFDLRSVKRVCKTWEQVVVSQSFRRSYKSTATLVEGDCKCSVHAMHFIEVRDISNKALRWRPGFEFNDKAFRCWKPKICRAITSHINGLVFAITYTYPNREAYVCNLFANTWEGVPWKGVPILQEEYFPYDQMAIFDLGGGHYKVVYWKTKHETLHMTSKILILKLEEGQKQQEKNWCEAYSDSGPNYTDPVVIGSSMFCVNVGHELLVEYNHEDDKVKSTQITSTSQQGERLFDLNLGYIYLIVWQAKLHVVKQHDEGDTVDVWQISTCDGRATLLHRFRMGQRVDWFDVFEVDDEGVLHLEGRVDKGHVEGNDASISSVWYDMVAKTVREKSVISGCTTYRRTRLPIRLCSS